MKQITFEHLTKPDTNKPRAANNFELLINDIAEQTHPPERRKDVRKRLAIAARTARWTEMDLHALLKKRNDPSIRNYSAFVNWSCKIRKV